SIQNQETGVRFAFMRFADRQFGAWLCRAIALLRWLSRTHIHRVDHAAPPAPESVREILIMKFLGLGSILQATPLLQALRHRYPAARLTLLTFRANSGLEDLYIGVDGLVSVDASSLRRFLTSNVAVLRQLRQVRFD